MTKVILFEQYTKNSVVIIKWNKSRGYYMDIISPDDNLEKMGINLNRLNRDRISINNYLDCLIGIGLTDTCRIAVVKLKQKFNKLTVEMTSEW
jgi:hypothetical protein